MKLTRLFTGLAAALATAMFVGLAAPAVMAQSNPAPAAPAAAPAPPAAAPAAAAAAKPAPPATPACAGAVAAIPETDKFAAVPAVPAVLTNCTPSGGDTAWMLTSMALVLMMTIPGLGLFYGGMVRQEKCRRHGDDQLRHNLPGDGSVCGCDVFARVHRWLPVRRRVQPRVPARHPQRHQQRRRSETQIRLRRRSPRPSTCASR